VNTLCGKCQTYKQVLNNLHDLPYARACMGCSGAGMGKCSRRVSRRM
jgi:hypothetical protein